MRYSLLKPVEKLPERAWGPMLLVGAFCAVFTLSLTGVFAPQFLQSLPEATLAGITGLTLIYSGYATLVRGFQFPRLFHGVIFLFFQWLGQFRTCLEQGRFPAGLWSPLTLLYSEPAWFMVTLLGGGVALYLSNSLLAIQKLPKAPPLSRLDISRENFYLNVGPWEKNWKKMQYSIFGAIIITVLCYLLDVKRFNLLTGIFFWLQLGVGVWVLLIGHFYYRRAVWKAKEQAPDPETKPVWGRILAVWFSVAALISLILPVNWRLDQWWLVQFFVNLERFIFDPKRVKSAPQVMDLLNKLKRPAKIPLRASTSGTGLTTLIFNGIWHLIYLAGLLLFLILIYYLIKPFLTKEKRRLKGLPKAFLKLFLVWRKWWRRRSGGLSRVRRLRGVPEGVRLKEATGLAGGIRENFSFGHGPRAVIRRGYYRLIQSARHNGYAWRQDQTPKEIGTLLNSMVPQSETALTGITDSYQQARYGPKPPTGSLARLFERLRREIQNQLRFLKKQN